MHYQCRNCSNVKECCEISFTDLEQSCPDNFSCCCYEKPKAKGKFGVAYIMETSENKCGSPFGWQVEFEDTPSKIDHNCKKMMKWVRSPPLGECNNIETNFLCYPEICGRFLRDVKHTCHKEKQAGSCQFIKRPKVMCNCPKPSCCSCQKCCREEELKNYCCRNATLGQLPKCSCFESNKFNKCRFCCTRQKINYKECLEPLPKCECGPSSDLPQRNCCCKEHKKVKCLHCVSKCCNCEEKGEAERVCSGLQKSQTNCCASDEQVCFYCGKGIEKIPLTKKSCSCDINEDNLDYIPKRDTSLINVCCGENTKDSCTQYIKPTDGNNFEKTVPNSGNQQGNRREIERNKNPNTKENKIIKKDGYTKGNTKMQNKNVEEKQKRRSKHQLKGGEADVERVEKEVKSTSYDLDQLSLLGKIKKAHHKQLQEIHPKVD